MNCTPAEHPTPLFGGPPRRAVRGPSRRGWGAGRPGRAGVADNSQHLYGRALDIHLGARIEDAIQAARAMQRGGVGWYPHPGFFPYRHRTGA